MGEVIKLKVVDNNESIKLKHDEVEEVTKIIEVPIPSADMDKLVDRSITELVTGVTKIGQYALANSLNLTTASGENVETIDTRAFYYCRKLTEINFPNVVTIKDNAFYNCPLTKELTFTKLVTASYSSFNSTKIEIFNAPELLTIEGSVFRETPLKHINAPKVTSIGSYAFNSCLSLLEAVFPEVTYIDDSAFYNCSKAVVIDLGKPTYIGSQVFNYVTGDVYIRTTTMCKMVGAIKYFKGRFFVPAELVDEYKVATNWSDWADKIFAIGEE